MCDEAGHNQPTIIWQRSHLRATQLEITEEKHLRRGNDTADHFANRGREVHGNVTEHISDLAACTVYTPSSLVTLLITMYAWGLMTGVFVHRICKAAVADGLDHPEVALIALLCAYHEVACIYYAYFFLP